MSLTNAEEPKFEEASLRTPGLGWRIGIIALGVILAVMACGLVVVALGQSTWAISKMGDPGLSPESRSRLEALRAEVDAIGTAPEAVEWMGDALDPNADGTSVLAYLRAAQKALEMADDQGNSHPVPSSRAGMAVPAPCAHAGMTILRRTKPPVATTAKALPR
jgi:hypothetical protein